MKNKFTNACGRVFGKNIPVEFARYHVWLVAVVAIIMVASTAFSHAQLTLNPQANTCDNSLAPMCQ